MRRATHAAAPGDWPAEAETGSVTLVHDDRHRRRLRLTTDAGEAILLDLDRTVLLRDGDGLRLDDGSWVRVNAAPEDVVDVCGATQRDTVCLAWHLGNRHLPVQILGDGSIRFRDDHVIEAMVRGLGGRTEHRRAPFTPEGGAYASGAHHHRDRDGNA